MPALGPCDLTAAATLSSSLPYLLFGGKESGRGQDAGRTVEFKETDADRTWAAPFLPLRCGNAGRMAMT
eukprot:gene13779-biopygen20063